MEIRRDYYLEKMIKRKNNGLIKVVTGIRRCGKSFLLNNLFYHHLLESGVDTDHIIRFAFDSADDLHLIGESLIQMSKEKRGADPEKFTAYIRTKVADGGMYYSENGDELKKFSTLDGLGMRLMREKGIRCGIVTGENTKLVARRAEKLHLDILKMGIKDKLSVVKELCGQYGISLQEVAYVGDDINDKELLEAVGFSASVPGAMDEVKAIVDYVTKRQGGSGAVREVIECILAGHE